MNYRTTLSWAMNKFLLLSFFSLLAFAAFLPATTFSQIPPKPNPPRLVNDFAHLMSDEQVASLEKKLVDLSDSTSTQVVIVTVNSLNGETIEEMAYKIGDSWGVGGKNQDNGIVILVSKEDRNVTIQTGREWKVLFLM